MVVIGLLAGVAGGKSTVAEMLAACGATAIDADALAHAALDDPDVRAAILARFGHEVLRDRADPDSAIDRAALASRVFGNESGATEARHHLESLVHPWVRARIQHQLDAARAAGAPAVVLDIPLLIGSPFEALVDTILFVDTPRETRLQRARDSRGWDETELARREAAQPSEADKRARADYIIDNRGSIKRMRRRVDTLFAELVPR